MLLSVFLFLFPFVSVASNSKPTCIASGDEKPINQALMRGESFHYRLSDTSRLSRHSRLAVCGVDRMIGGKGAIVTLCQGSTHRIHSPIMFTTSRQTLTTEGNPKDRERAMLVVEGEDQAVAVKWVHFLYHTSRSIHSIPETQPEPPNQGLDRTDGCTWSEPTVKVVLSPWSVHSSSMVTDHYYPEYPKAAHCWNWVIVPDKWSVIVGYTNRGAYHFPSTHRMIERMDSWLWV